MKLLIAGSRNLTNIDISPYIPKNTTLIIAGGAVGVDTLAEEYAKEHRISRLIVLPRYDLYNKKAPLIRNEKMAELCDKALIFWDGVSRGTKYTIDYVLKLKKPLQVITFEN